MTSNTTNLGASSPLPEGGKSLVFHSSRRLTARLNSNYKGFPICQARGIHRAAPRLDSFVVSALQPDYFTALMRIASSLRDKVRTDKLQPVIDAASCAADPDERRAQEPHSLAAVGRCRRLELTRHTPRRSNLAHQRVAFTRWKESVLSCGSAVFVGLHAGNLKRSPLASIAQAMRAFLAAMATTAFQ